MEVFTTAVGLRKYLEPVAGVGFVPTMGALHEGHLSLVEASRRDGGVTVVSVFVNPTQFNDPEDLRRYPRTLEADLEKLAAAGVDAVFVPSVEEVYPQPDTRNFDFGRLDKVMEGATRPGHFNGVAQVVSRLFDLVKPERAYFGQKDFQQVAVIRAMVAQLGYDIRIVECPIVREPDGLAMSSRNALLDAGHRAAAPGIYAALQAAAAEGRRLSPPETEKMVAERINKDPLLDVIYMNIVDPRTLERLQFWGDGPARGCIAVQAGKIRLIDNIGL